MYILVVNDDGPPTAGKSPYIAPFVRALEQAGHSVVVVVPHIPRSWMSKGHIRGENIHVRSIQPPSAASDRNNWFTIDGTPAACVQVGLFHLASNSRPFDLVISGPNAGANVGTISNLCSGTLGASMEAALCRKHAIALSFAFASEDDNMVSKACQKSLQLIEYLYISWPEAVDVYNVNVPLPSANPDSKVLYTEVLRNRWTSPSFYIHAETEQNKADCIEEMLTWRSTKDDVQRSRAQSLPGTDAWAIKEGHISVTPFSADFACIKLGDTEVMLRLISATFSTAEIGMSITPSARMLAIWQFALRPHSFSGTREEVIERSKILRVIALRTSAIQMQNTNFRLLVVIQCDAVWHRSLRKCLAFPS